MEENPKSLTELVGSKTLLQQLFPIEADRPTVRWLEYQRKKRLIPWYKVGGKVCFSVGEVRDAMNKTMRIASRP